MHQKVLSMILVLVMLLGLLSVSAFTVTDTTSSDSADSTEFMRIFHLDCGRKYFSVSEIEGIIDQLAANHYTHLQLAFGNNGFRFLLDEMPVGSYTSDQVRSALTSGNKTYSTSKSADNSMLSESNMDAIIAYAEKNGISIIPLMNAPGHMDAVIYAMQNLGMSGVSYNKSTTTIDVTNSTAVNFTKELLQLYVNYFAGKGCKYFNMGADEYANDIYKTGDMGFGQLISDKKYAQFAEYVNSIAAIIKNAKMTPMAFNDGIYYKQTTTNGNKQVSFDKDIVICYWTAGWGNGSYSPASASFLAGKGLKIINTNDAWYYVLGRTSGSYALSGAKNGVANTKVTSIPGDNNATTPVGAMMCLWCDTPSASYSAQEQNNVKSLIQTLSENNKTYFTAVTPSEPEILTSTGSTQLDVHGGNATLSISDGSEAVWTVDPADGSVIKLISATNPDSSTITGSRVEAVAAGKGTATVTATVGSKTYTMQLTVVDPNEYTISVGGTKTITVSGNCSGEYQMDQPDVATVKTKYQQSAASSTKYSATASASIEAYWAPASPASNVIDGDTSTKYWSSSKQTEGAYVQVDLGAAIPFDTVRLTSPSNTDDYCDAASVLVSEDGSNWMEIGSYTGNTSTPIAFSNTLNEVRYIRVEITKAKENWWQLSEIEWGNTVNGTFTRMPASGTVTTEAKDETSITFNGLSVGDTTVTIGGVLYTIHVVDRATDDAMTASTINLEYWITNYEVYEGESTSTEHIKAVSSSDANSDAGIAITDIAPNHAYSFFEGTKDVYYWQAMRLDADNQQTNASGDDETADGTTLTHIRYHSGAWQYKTTDGVWHYFVSTDQLVAYYLQKTEVTKEIDTYAKDWGYGTSGTTPDTSSSKGQVALTVAVVYPDGTVSPAEGKMYANSTTIFNYWDGRDIGIVAPTNNSDYNISKITVTDGERDNNSSKNVWYTNDTITWEKTTDSATGKTWYDETEVWNKSSGTTPMVNGKTSNITWSAKNAAKLVLIYLEPVERETNLNVVYWDDNANVKITGSQIAMKYTHGDPVPSFTNDLKGVTSGATSWPSNDKNSSGYLPDEAYVTNSSGVKQTLNKDLLTVSGVTGVYASGLYEYVSANISEDGKTLTLHYNLKQTDGKTYVLDFGLPIKIPAADFGIENYNSVSSISFDSSDTTVREKPGEYGKGKIDMSDGSVTYTLTKAIDSKVAIPIYVTFKGGQTTQRLQVYVIPATSVYYEDSLATFENGTGAASDARWAIVDDNDQSTADKSANVNQALSALGEKKIYGYDTAYDNSTKLSMGSAHKVTVKSDMYVKGDTTTTWPTATFTFKGTGFDVISLTDNNSGAISVKVYSVGSDGTETQVKGKLVNNYYGYTYKDGKWTATPTETNNALYQIPVIKIDDLTYGTYKVVITASYASYADKTGDGQYSFWLDAIRVYNPMDKDNATYAQDEEGYPQYIKLRDSLAKDSTATADAVFIDGAEKADVALYTNYGPNNEVYLANGQAITFNVPVNANIVSVQIGAKAPDGQAAKMVVNGKETDIASATEMYYKIAQAGGNFTITNTGTGVLSLTNLKITFTASGNTVTLTPPTAEEQNAAVMSVRALFAAPAEPFQPDRFEASWGHAVRKGDTATLTVKTSEDVESITVDGQKITTYDTKTERTGWGWWAKTVTYREFTYTDTAVETKKYTVCAVNSDGVSSDPITATLTVRPSVRDWWHGIFDKWF